MSDSEEKDLNTSTEDEGRMEIDLKETDKGAGGDSASDSETKTPPKNNKKDSNKKKYEESESDSNSDDEPAALLEQPVVVSGKRERRKVERIDISAGATPKEKKFEIPAGKGTLLGDIPNVFFKLNKIHSEELKIVHRLIYGRPGSGNEIKKNIRKFCGFDFKKDSPEFKKKEGILNKMFLPQLKIICDVLDLEKGGTKEHVISRLMNFLLKPCESGKQNLADVAAKKKRKRERKASKKEKSKKKSGGTKKTKKEGSKKKKLSKSESEIEDDSDDDSDSDEEVKEKTKPKKEATKKKKVESESENEDSDDDDDESDEEDSEDEAPKKKKAKIEPKKEIKKPAKKATPPKKKSPKKKEDTSDEDDSSSGSESDDEPLSKQAAPKPPSNDELRGVIKKILDGANLEDITMKTVCKQVYAKYEKFDLTDRKDFIKSTVKEIIQ